MSYTLHPLIWPDKGVDEVRPYGLDFTDDLDDIVETISSFTVTVLQGTVIVSNQARNGAIIAWDLSGGTVGEVVKIKVKITTNHAPPHIYTAVGSLKVTI